MLSLLHRSCILGPLIEYDGGPIVVGIASFGAEDCDYPNVYARVSAAVDWITDWSSKH